MASRLQLFILTASLLLAGPDLRAARSGDNARAAEARPLALGLIAPPSDVGATSLIRGAQTAVDEANAEGVASVRLEVRAENGQWGSAGNDAVILVCERHVDALITPTDGADSHLILQVAGRTRVPVASVCADASITGAGVPWAIRVVPQTDTQVSTLLTAAGARSAPQCWWAVIPAGRAARPIRRDLAAGARAAASDIDRFIEVEANASLPEIARAIVTAAPTGVLLWVPDAAAGNLAAVLREAGYRGSIAGPCSLESPVFLAHAKSATESVLIPALRREQESRAAYAAFASRYRERYGAEPDFIAAAAHDAVHALIATLRQAIPAETYRAFPPTREIAGATGTMRFDRLGNRTDPLEVTTARLP